MNCKTLNPDLRTSITLQLRHMKFVKNHQIDETRPAALSGTSQDSLNRPTNKPVHGDSQISQANTGSHGPSHRNECNSTQQSNKFVSPFSPIHSPTPVAGKVNTVRCFTCESDVGLQELRDHLFFGQLQCINCCMKLKDCEEFKRSYESNFMKCCLGKNGKHEFEKWLDKLEEYLAYQIRKDLKIETYVNNSEFNVTVHDVNNRILKYMKSLNCLEHVAPWKFALHTNINACYYAKQGTTCRMSCVTGETKASDANVTKSTERRVYINKRLNVKQSVSSSDTLSTPENTRKDSASNKISENVEDSSSEAAAPLQSELMPSLQQKNELPSTDSHAKSKLTPCMTQKKNGTASKVTEINTQTESATISKGMKPSTQKKMITVRAVSRSSAPRAQQTSDLKVKKIPIYNLKTDFKEVKKIPICTLNTDLKEVRKIPTCSLQKDPASDTAVKKYGNPIVLKKNSAMVIIIKSNPGADASTKQTGNTAQIKDTSPDLETSTEMCAKENTSFSASTSVSADLENTTETPTTHSAFLVGSSDSTEEGIVSISANATAETPCTRSTAETVANTAPKNTNKVKSPASTDSASSKTAENMENTETNHADEVPNTTKNNTSDIASSSASAVTLESSAGASTINSSQSRAVVTAPSTSGSKKSNVHIYATILGKKILMNTNPHKENDESAESQKMGTSAISVTQKASLVSNTQPRITVKKRKTQNETPAEGWESEGFVSFLVSVDNKINNEVLNEAPSATMTSAAANEIVLEKNENSQVMVKRKILCEKTESSVVLRSSDAQKHKVTQNDEKKDKTSASANEIVLEKSENSQFMVMRKILCEQTEGSVVLRSSDAQKRKVTQNDEKKDSKKRRSESKKYEFIPREIFASGRYLIVEHPAQVTPHQCPNCYCNFDNTMVKVCCSYFIVNILCPDCKLNIYTIPADNDRKILRERCA